MRVHSLYLSTLTGANQITLTATITGGNTLNVATISSPFPLAVGQYIVNSATGLIITKILGFGNTGVGGTGDYAIIPTTNIGTAITLYAYDYSTNSTKNSPVNRNTSVGSSSSAVRFSINWKEIFGDWMGECRVRCRFISTSSNAINWSSNVGSIRATIGSTHSNVTNGAMLGFVRPQSDYTSGTSNYTYLDCDTTTSNGVSVQISQMNTDFTVLLLDKLENQMTNVPDYQLWLFFDVDTD